MIDCAKVTHGQSQAHQRVEGAGLGLAEERLGRDPWYVSPHDPGSLILLWSVVFKLMIFFFLFFFLRTT